LGVAEVIIDALARVEVPPVTLGDSIAYWASLALSGLQYIRNLALKPLIIYN
jgi:hypothetical protein